MKTGTWYAVAVYTCNGLDGIYNETEDLAEARATARLEANSDGYPYDRAEVVELNGNYWDTRNPVYTAYRQTKLHV